MRINKIIKITFTSFFAIVSLSPVFAQNSYEGKTVVVLSPESTTLSGEDRYALPPKVQARLQDNIATYMGMIPVVDEEAERILKEQQMRAESSAHDEDDVIEIGRIRNARYALTSRITKYRNAYSIDITLASIEGGEQISVSSRSHADPTELYNEAGAVDELTLLLSDRLGVNLSASDKYILRNGTANMTTEQLYELSLQEVERRQRQIEEWRRQRDAASSSTDIGAEARALALQASIDQEEKKLEVAREREERLRQQQEAERQAQQEASERSEEIQQLLLQMQRSNEVAAAQARSEQMESASPFQKMQIIEGKKEVLRGMQDELNAAVYEITQTASKDAETQRNAILHREYRTGELANGVPTAEARAARQEEAENMERQIMEQRDADILRITEAGYESRRQLALDILNDYENLRITEVRVSNSTDKDDDLQYIISAYDANKKGWPVHIYIYSDNMKFGEYETLLPYTALYEAVTGELAETQTNSERLDTIDVYNLLFLSGSPMLLFTVDYTLEAQTDSRYKIHYKQLTAKVRTNGNTVLSEKIDSTWMYGFSKPQDVESLLDEVRPEWNAAKRKQNFLDAQKGRTGVFASFDFSYNKLAMGIGMEGSALFGTTYFFWGGTATWLFRFSANTGIDGGRYELAYASPYFPLIGNSATIRLLGTGGATVTVGKFRFFLQADIGGYLTFCGSSAVIYEESGLIGGLLAAGLSIGIRPGVEFKFKKFSIGVAYSLYLDMGQGFSDQVSVTAGWKFW